MKLVIKKKTYLVLFLALSLAVSWALSGCGFQQVADTAAKRESQEAAGVVSQTPLLERPEVVTSGEEAKELLVAGNNRFVSGQLANKDLGSGKREKLTAGQKPFAVIVSCSDSRVPPELLFDQGLGDLFVIRVAGNVVDPDELGSVEYAVEHLGTPLVVVMGHEKCGAVKATVEAAETGGEVPGNIGAIVAKIKPSVEKAKAAGAFGDELVEKSVDENILATIAKLESSPIIKEAVEGGKLTILGAKYHLGSGQVEWFPATE